jgi:S-phase kinase-associated protein 1
MSGCSRDRDTAGANNIVELKTTEGESFFVSKASLAWSTLLTQLLKIGDDDAVPLIVPTVTAPTLAKVIEYLEHHKGEPSDEASDKLASISPWDFEFTNLDTTGLIELLTAATFLQINPLISLAAKRVSLLISGRSLEQIREIFKVKCEFTSEEEQEVRREVSFIEW